MITIGYGKHRTPTEVLVAQMMEQLAKEPYKNLRFENLEGKDWDYLREHAEDFAFDVHGGYGAKDLVIGTVVRSFAFPYPCFIIFSQSVEDRYLQFLKRFRMGEITLAHKNQEVYYNNVEWANVDADRIITSAFLRQASESDLEDRLIAVELLNASEKWQIEESHKPFMKLFLAELDSLERV